MFHKIKCLLTDSSLVGQEVQIFGWVLHIQKHPNILFVHVVDGSTVNKLQVTFKQLESVPQTLSLGAAIRATGVIKTSPGSQQAVELEASELEVMAGCSAEFPIQSQEMTLEHLRTVVHQRHRTQIIKAATLIKSEAMYGIHSFFSKEGFLNFCAPIFTTNSCEGGSDVFELSKEGEAFFKKKTLLTVSGQFYAEALALGFKDVYTLSPTFRAEKSNSSHHLAEFWMLEIEMSFAKLADLLKVAESFVKYVTAHVLAKCSDELKTLQTLLPENEGLIAKLEDLVSKEFAVVEYSKAITMLQEKVASGRVTFQTNKIEFGMNLASEHERYLSEKLFKSPVFVINYPKAIKAFYMKQNDDGLTVAATDLLLPFVGELIGGSQREESIDKIVDGAKTFGLDISQQGWYLDLRKFGYHSSAGFGLGLERLIMYYTGLKNIKDTIAFPRSYQQINY